MRRGVTADSRSRKRARAYLAGSILSGTQTRYACGAGTVLPAMAGRAAFSLSAYFTYETQICVRSRNRPAGTCRQGGFPLIIYLRSQINFDFQYLCARFSKLSCAQYYKNVHGAWIVCSEYGVFSHVLTTDAIVYCGGLRFFLGFIVPLMVHAVF